jgi:hypothetical protein
MRIIFRVLSSYSLNICTWCKYLKIHIYRRYAEMSRFWSSHGQHSKKLILKTYFPNHLLGFLQGPKGIEAFFIFFGILVIGFMYLSIIRSIFDIYHRHEVASISETLYERHPCLWVFVQFGTSLLTVIRNISMLVMWNGSVGTVWGPLKFSANYCVWWNLYITWQHFLLYRRCTVISNILI